jgi:hypothetical protein
MRNGPRAPKVLGAYVFPAVRQSANNPSAGPTAPQSIGAQIDR